MATNAAGRTIWNDKTRSDLLQAIFDVCPPGQQQWEAIEVKLREKGYTYGYSAALQHLQKLKRKDGDKKDGDKKDGDGPSTPKAPKTPKTPAKAPGARGRKPATPGTPSQNKKRKPIDFDIDEDEKDVKKLKLEVQAPNLGQYHEDEPNPPFDEGEA